MGFAIAQNGIGGEPDFGVMAKTLYVVPIPSSRAAWVNGSVVSPPLLVVPSMGCVVCKRGQHF